ncbi:hypothetical protein E2P81_ATG02045 [Venturia nashicola]|uniref:Uncharacterized protein n=1 Tax=Venturia nashicola TaxID=86259 RepID=A0A4Z1PCS3_9PEZI|nr:hypothetical protein E6O75_ATG02090 [Venturia nashicola]TLD35742.1 hypothetical protein E2P81_ATG02045 [Venturia nashicola]
MEEKTVLWDRAQHVGGSKNGENEKENDEKEHGLGQNSTENSDYCHQDNTKGKKTQWEHQAPARALFDQPFGM